MKRLKREAGLTLIELIMVMVIVGSLAGISSMYIKETIDLWNFLSFRSEISSSQRMALIRMSREIRQIDSITLAESARLKFDAVELDGAPGTTTIEFFRNAGNELRRVINNNNSGQGNILANAITDLSFTYYDANNQSLAVPVADTGEIKRIAFSLTAASGSQSKTLKTQIFPRGL